MGNARSTECYAFVGGIVEHLNVQPLARIIQGGGGVNHALHHIQLVINRELHRYQGPFGKERGRQNGLLMSALCQASELPLGEAKAQDKGQAQPVKDQKENFQSDHEQ
ncbi:hypothetical protein GCM10023186_33710 [Hymenobacter koreensis]|uniref:Uncharacterized protein n=1 Tax=Hymenobacter koreensis TaxID=1084523 RepID=A0ABP8JAM8_9BACT